MAKLSKILMVIKSLPAPYLNSSKNSLNLPNNETETREKNSFSNWCC